MKIQVTPRMLESVRQRAIDKFKNTQHNAIDASLQPVWCFISSFFDELAKDPNNQLFVELPERQLYESIDDE